MAKTDKGVFTPKNPEKYLGSNLNNITYRSGWELQVMNVFDTHPSIVKWASEAVSIPYLNPLTGRWSMYIPDFIVVYVDKNNTHHCDMIEVKPSKEVPNYQALNERGLPKRISKKDKLSQAVNAAKWKAAMEYCAKRGWSFRVATEELLFKYNRK
jgi:hypothetical protein